MLVNAGLRRVTRVSSLAQQVAAILAKYGTDAHVYLPGIGTISGLTAGNWLDSAGTTPATVDNPVGKVDDAAGAIDATQGTTANKPILRRGAVNRFKYNNDLSRHGTALKNGSTASDFQTINCAALSNSGFSPEVSSATDAFIAPAVGKYTIVYDIAAGSLSSIFVGVDAGNCTLTSVGPYGVLNLTPEFQRVTYKIDVTVSGTVFRLQMFTLNSTAGTFKIKNLGLFLGDVSIDTVPSTTTAPASSTTGNYKWEFDATDVLSATFPAGYESVTTIDAAPTGQVTLTAQNIVGTYNITTDTHGRFVFKTLTAGELATMQTFANSLAGL